MRLFPGPVDRCGGQTRADFAGGLQPWPLPRIGGADQRRAAGTRPESGSRTRASELQARGLTVVSVGNGVARPGQPAASTQCPRPIRLASYIALSADRSSATGARSAGSVVSARDAIPILTPTLRSSPR